LSLSIKGRSCAALHFVGILGSGMSALAQFCRWSGMRISGSDRLLEAPFQAPVRAALQSIGCTLSPQDGSGVAAGCDAVIVSTAIEETNADIAAARSRGIEVFHRSDVLAAIVNSRRSIAVAGTSGKSTVTALLFHLLDACDMGPSLITGANLHALIERGHIGNAWTGKSDLMVFEADESDGSINRYSPAVSLVLNVSRDHKPVPEVVALFAELARRSGLTFINHDDPALATVPAGASFGTVSGSLWHCEGMRSATDSVTVSLRGLDYTIPFPGKHNGRNLLAALSVCLHLGCAPERLQAACPTFTGLQRRFDRIATRRGVTVIDDYAHNPEKIEAAVSTAQSLCDRLFVLFQPHGFGPTRFMFDELVAMLGRVIRSQDVLIILPIYFAGGTVCKDISARDIADALSTCAGKVLSPDHRDQAAAMVASMCTTGDVVISMGARDPSLPEYAQAMAAAIDKEAL
jgi:UDP-N-acetylmuramate--alanine ligase